MSKLKLYSLALTAKKYEGQVLRIVLRVTTSLAQYEYVAVGKGVATARKLWPVKESWFSHEASVHEIPAWMIDVVYLKEGTDCTLWLSPDCQKEGTNE